ncbi:hypothetical protein M1N19_02110, partial [Dehalococcoidia bacterium]|nr:hypothetical protein [Dehalococcoidia bacterium]
MFQKLACGGFRVLFRTFTGNKYPRVASSAHEAYEPRVAGATFASIATSPGAEALYSWRFARIPSTTIEQWAKEHNSSPEISMPLLKRVAEHVSSIHILGCQATHGPAEAWIIEEFLHHETVKDSPFFWLSNNYSYFKRLGFFYLHIRRKSLARKEGLLDLGRLSDSEADRLVKLVSQDNLALDAFLFSLIMYRLWLEIQECCLPIVEAVWKEPDEAERNYGQVCREACEMLRKMTGNRVQQLQIAKALVDIPMDWLKNLYSHIPTEHQPMTRLREVHAKLLPESCSWRSVLSLLPISARIYKSTKIGYWYFGLLPDYLLWFYIKYV